MYGRSGRQHHRWRVGSLEGEKKERGGKLTWHLGSSVDELGLDVVEEGSLDGYTRLC